MTGEFGWLFIKAILFLPALKVKITSSEAEGEFLTYNANVEAVIEKGEYTCFGLIFLDITFPFNLLISSPQGR